MPVNKNRLPELAKTPSSIRTLADAKVIGKDNMYKIPLHLLDEEEGYNPRDYNSPKCVAQIRAFADAHKAGHYVPPIEFRAANGRTRLIEGHLRRRGALIAIDKGTVIPG
jgi:hypothetical protein